MTLETNYKDKVTEFLEFEATVAIIDTIKAEYARTFLGVKFEDYKIQESVGINYSDFLEVKYPDNFLVKLISCPICLTTWLSAGAAFYLENLLVFFLIFYLSLFFYFKFKKFMRESYE